MTRRISFPPARRTDSIGCLTLTILGLGALLFLGLHLGGWYR